MLGTVDVTVDGEPPPAELLWRKNLALLVYLALSPRHTRSREHLTGLLWGGKPESAARHSLNEALRVLRRVVGEQALQTDATSVKLDPAAVALDTDEFARHEAAREWAEASALVSGSFLEGFAVPGESEFEDWLVAERLQWERRSVAALVETAAAELARGQLAAALGAAERAIALAPTSGAAAGMLLRALALSGNRAAALSRYAEYVTVLRDQVGLGPDDALVKLADRIRQDRLEPPAGSDAALVAGTRRLPLAGRRTELEVLTSAWRQCVAQQGTSVAVLLGDAGLGKTRLAEELVARVALEGGTVLKVRGVESDAASPWAGLIGLGRGGLIEASGIASAPAPAHAAFAAHIAEWGDRYRGTSGETPAPLGRAFTELVRATALEQPVLVVVDDCHCLDVESLQSLASLPRDLPDAPVLLLLTAEPLPPSETLDTLRTRFGRDLRGEALELAPLDADALAGMARAVFPRYDEAAIHRLARRLAADSAGVPLLAIEILHAIASGLPAEEAGTWPTPYHTLTETTPGDLPDTVIAAVRIGYRRLSEPAQRALAAAAALGGRLRAEEIGRAAALAAPLLDGALDELEWQRWLVSDGRGYDFVARIVERIIARDMLTPGQRRRMREAAGRPA